MINTIQPVGERVLIVPHKEEKKDGLLIVPDKAEVLYKIVAVGDDVKFSNIGDVVIVNIYHENVFRHPDFMIVDEVAIVGIKR